MGAYFAYEYSGEPFRQLGVAHLSALAVIAGLILFFGRFPLGEDYQRKIRISLAALIGVNELIWHFWHVFHHLWTVQTLLPLEICNLMVIASVWVLLTKNQVGYEFVYLLGIPAAIQVLITPALGRYGFPHILFFQIFISHGGIIVAALYLTLNEHMRPASWRSVRHVVMSTTLYSSVIFLVDLLLGSNYLFLIHKPASATLLDYLGPWPWYIFSMVAVGICLVCLLYLPFHYSERKSTKRM